MAHESPFTAGPRPLPGDNTPPPPVQIDPTPGSLRIAVTVWAICLAVIIGVVFLAVK